MKIVYITSDYIYNIGGISQHIENITKIISKTENVVIIYLNKKGKNDFITDEFGRKIYFINHDGNKLERFIKYPTNRIDKIIEKERPDIIHVHTLFEAFKLKKYKAPMIFTNHSSSYLRMYNNPILKKYILPKVLSKFNLIIAPSTERYKKTLHKRVLMIPNGVDLERFNLSNRYNFNKSDVLQKFNITYNQEKILFSPRRLAKEHGIFDFLKSNLNYFKKNINNVIYLVLGKGDEFQKVKKLKDVHGLKNIYLLGEVENKNIDELYYISDFTIIPSKVDAICLAGLEAMASGSVVIATKIDGLAELIKDNYNGVFLKNNLLVENIIIDLDKEKQDSIKNNALHYVEKNYSWSNIAQETYNVYKSF